MEIIINFKIKNLTKNSKSRKYIYSHKISRKALHHFTASQIQRWSLPSLILLHWRLSNSEGHISIMFALKGLVVTVKTVVFVCITAKTCKHSEYIAAHSK